MNFKHLRYFWAAAKAGGVVRAGRQLHVSPQTLSGQIKLLEARLGCVLLRKAGRGLELTDEGRLVLGYAEQIFGLSAELESVVGKSSGAKRPLGFRVGIADSVPKAIAYRLLEPALAMAESVHLICHEGSFSNLLGRLAVHGLDLVIADEPMRRQTHVKAHNHLLGATAMSFFATPALKRKLSGAFPRCLDGVPILLQGSGSAMRQRFDFWLVTHAIRPLAIGEFDDAALLQAFGGEGRGVFMAPSVLEAEVEAQHRVRVIGRTDELVEEFYAVSAGRHTTHPCIAVITKAARDQLFGAA